MNRQSLLECSANYVEAFNAKDLDAVAAMLHADFSLTDGIVRGVAPKPAALDVIRGLFTDFQGQLSFTARNIYADPPFSFIEFDLRLGDMILEGVDVIEWRDGRLYKMRAFLNQLNQ